MNKKDGGMDKLHIPYATRAEAVMYAALGCFNVVLLALAIEFLEVSAAIAAVVAVFLYLCEIAVIGYKRAASAKIMPKQSIYALLEEDGSKVFEATDHPVVVFDSFGVILWYNDAMREEICAEENFIGRDMDELFSFDENDVKSGEVALDLEIAGRVFRCESFRLSDNEDGLYLMLLHDETALREISKKYDDERVAVAYIAIDNVEDVLQYVHDKYASAVTKIDERLKEWAASMNGVIKAYDNEKYVMFLDSARLDECVADRFSILDEVRDARVGDGVSVTVSIGVSCRGNTLFEREAEAKDAVDMALQRGGDQAVYVSSRGTEFYGGKTKSVYKRSNVRSRTFASQLSALMVRSDNVIIMGHRYGDFDSFGAAVGVARLATLTGTAANIAVDLRDRNLAPCIEMLQKSEAYAQTFVDNAGALDLISPDTLVILVDHNTLARAQFSDIAEKAAGVVVIDHHRKVDAFHPSVKISYVEPSASSTCELVTEMLESSVSSQSLMKEEADLLLAGILLDTKQFTRNTGTRTFGAAQYLRGAGANPTDVYNLFKTAPEDLSKEARFHTAITMYKENVAIACCDGDTDESYRIIASKAADKMLTLRGVEAAFTLVRIGEQIHISGRSSGTINVQLILEKLKGGGHFDVAGAQVTSESIVSVLETLKESIDEHLGA